MRGFPKTIGSRQDLENLLALPEHAAAARAKLQELEAGRQVWVTTEVLAKGEAGTTAKGKRVIEVGDKETERLQQELKDDPGAAWVRLDLAGLKTDVGAVVVAEQEVQGAK